MKNRFKSSYLKLIVFFIFLTFSTFTFNTTVHAETIDTVSTSQDLQSKINSAMHSRLTSYSIKYTGSTTNLNTVITDVINNIYNSDDYLHYTSRGYGYSATINNGIITINFNFTYWNTVDQDAYVNTRVTEILNQIITTNMSDYEKEKAIHDWIEKNVSYDTTFAKHSAYDALVSPYSTVCQGYSLLAYKLLTQAGIPTKIIEGTADGGDHAWNLVYIDGAWYHLDTTWDDPVPDEAGRVTYPYYNLTDTQIRANHSWVKTYPSAVTDFNDKLNSKLVSDPTNSSIYQGLIDGLGLNLLAAQNTVYDATGLHTKIQDAINNQQNSIKVRYMNENTLSTDIVTALKGIPYLTSYSYSYDDCVRSTTLGDVILDLSFTYSNRVGTSSVSLSSNDLTLVAGTSSTLTATVLPSNASNKNIIWTTSNANIATVSNGVVKAVNGGIATITATTADGGYTSACNVKVTPAISSTNITSTTQNTSGGGTTLTNTVPVTGVSISSSSTSVKIGSNLPLTAIISPTNATNKSLIWTSSNTSVATVDSNGNVKALAYGTTVITATSIQDSTKMGKCTVIVPVPVTAVSITSSSTLVNIGGSLPLTAIISPTNATNKTVTWTSSNPNIATVSSTGVVTPIAPGSVTITAKTSDGNFTATKVLNVIYGVNSVTLNKTYTYIKLGANQTLTATVYPSNATNKSLVWKSSNLSVAKVDSNGNVKALAYGTAIITATSVQDSTKLCKCTVTVPVPNPVTGVSIISNSDILKIGGYLPLTTVISPTNATIKTVTWTSSNTAIAKVSATGIVTPVTTGSVTITAITTDGKFKATKTLKVVNGDVSSALFKYFIQLN